MGLFGRKPPLQPRGGEPDPDYGRKNQSKGKPQSKKGPGRGGRGGKGGKQR